VAAAAGHKRVVAPMAQPLQHAMLDELKPAIFAVIREKLSLHAGADG